MARDALKINLELDYIHCHDEGDGWGNAEPYLWTVFFKVDGSTVTVNDTLTLDGNATVVTTPGSHGNLGTTDVDEGDNVTIPDAIGHWSTVLKPIGVEPPLDSLIDDLGGVVGVIAVLMEEDNVSDDGAEAGHQALNNAVEAALNQIVATRSVSNQDVTDEELNEFTGSIESTISDAIQSQQNFFENLWSWLNKDDSIGHQVWIFKHDDLADGGTINFSRHWGNEGSWTLHGHITSSVICPAGAMEKLFSGQSSARSMEKSGEYSARMVIDAENIDRDKEDKRKPAEIAKARSAPARTFDLDALRKFRDSTYRDYPGLSNWWGLAKRNAPAIVYTLLKQPELRAPAFELMKYLATFARNPEEKIPSAILKGTEQLLQGTMLSTGNRRLSIDCSRALSMLPMLQRKSGKAAMELLSSLQPSRHPGLRSEPLARITKPAEVVKVEARLRKEVAAKRALVGRKQ